MATLDLRSLNKIYPNNVQAVFDFNLKIEDGEFIVFVGPSGCGKSTTLRMVAGLEEITYGDLFIDGERVNDVEPMNRGIAMVFQSYALYPHMTVYRNMAFSLMMRKFPVPVFDNEGKPVPAIDKVGIRRAKKAIKDAKFEIKAIEKIPDPDGEGTAEIEELKKLIAEKEEEINKLKANPSVQKVKMVHMNRKEIDQRVNEAARILGLSDYLKRKPGALSGGQRQRVALGRAIVRAPKVFLMDEPLSNLDAKLRVQMRSELIRIHKDVGATTIYVTHDQTEAMTMADRIVVMKDGYIQQIATPKEIYTKPANLFVATFVGSPSMNILEGTYNKEFIEVEGGLKIAVSEEMRKAHDLFYVEQTKVSEAAVERLGKELDVLRSSKLKKRNKDAIAQREAALEQHKKNLEFYAAVNAGNDHKIRVGVRPEHACLEGYARGELSAPIKGEVTFTELLGEDELIYTSIGGQKLVLKSDAGVELNDGDSINYQIRLDKLHIFDFSSSLRIE